ncbi:bifunctional DNA primase/polymerase [Gryllotalpicola protaetiae]|uniref:DNA primase n=1 Tax=Gryllotalpicola protaetiae TaxID=2419771 RepID=A0A387C263_9MICO|nr:bifunctional DNA primase/polymerase [Gryllotalpicola protaetiae]AYG04601.1 DNA primase [Gryllotalpicola protaetiae]
MSTAGLFAQVADLPPAAAARRLAHAGVPVFPCVPDGKRPLTRRGFHDASTDPAQVEPWWRRWPAANIGVPTGAASGFVVVDVDVHGPVDGRVGFGRATVAGLTGGWEMLVRTPTGGMHAYYPATPGTEQRSWQAGRAGVDFRGDGGYIIVPPSARTIAGTTARYRVEEVGSGPARTLDAGRLRNVLAPRPDPRPRPGTWQPVGREDAERLARWLDRQDTDRNLKLFWASCRLAEGGVPLADALDAVLTAAKSDFGPREIAATVRSAYRTVRPEPARRESPPVRGESSESRWFGRHATTGSLLRGRGL